LAGGVAEAVGLAGFELGDAVQALGAGIRDAGQDGVDDLVLPAGDGAGERDQFFDLLVLGAPVVEGGEAAADLALGRGAAGDAGAEVQRGAEFLLGDPGQAMCWPGPVASRVSMTFSNCSPDRFSRFFSSRCLMPYSGLPDLPRRP